MVDGIAPLNRLISDDFDASSIPTPLNRLKTVDFERLVDITPKNRRDLGDLWWGRLYIKKLSPRRVDEKIASD